IKPLTYSGKYEEFNTQNNWVTKLPKNSDGSVTIPVGYYFCMGDNRNDSLDCRNFGPLATTSCIGVVETILYKGNIFNTILTWLAGLNTSEAVIK
ncbi:MAG: S26 family signal peptidase, partial [Clostridia bacterium]|nr:S26 family signal peptidase [Clostridia bacterium]